MANGVGALRRDGLCQPTWLTRSQFRDLGVSLCGRGPWAQLATLQRRRRVDAQPIVLPVWDGASARVWRGRSPITIAESRHGWPAKRFVPFEPARSIRDRRRCLLRCVMLRRPRLRA